MLLSQTLVTALIPQYSYANCYGSSLTVHFSFSSSRPPATRSNLGHSMALPPPRQPFRPNPHKEGRVDRPAPKASEPKANGPPLAPRTPQEVRAASREPVSASTSCRTPTGFAAATFSMKKRLIVVITIVFLLLLMTVRGRRGRARAKTKSRIINGLPITGKFRDPESDQYYNNNNGAKIILSSHFDYEYVLGHKIAFLCVARGNPRPQITWFKDGIELYAHYLSHVHEWKMGKDKVKSKLEIDPATQMDAGIYECSANNMYSIDSRSFKTDFSIAFD